MAWRGQALLQIFRDRAVKTGPVIPSRVVGPAGLNVGIPGPGMWHAHPVGSAIKFFGSPEERALPIQYMDAISGLG